MNISCSSVRRILKEGECNVTGEKPFSMSQKRRIRKKTKTEVDEFNNCMIHTIIKAFHITES
jgi:hypothetical protein